MMKPVMGRIALCLLGLCFAHGAAADTMAQFAAPNLRAPDDPNVSGARFSFLHGKNESMRGVDFGLLSLSETSRMSGVAFVGGVHKVDGEMNLGAAFSIVNYHTSRDSGLNWAFVNLLEEAPGALNLGFITFARGATLVDLGGINISKRSTAQIGLLNMTEEIESFQFGFLNMAENGFLPIFPVFNFAVD